MVTLQRGDSDTYVCETGLAELNEVAEGTKRIPTDWINDDGVSMNYPFVKYALPLIQGEVDISYESGVPSYVKLRCLPLEKRLGAYEL